MKDKLIEAMNIIQECMKEYNDKCDNNQETITARSAWYLLESQNKIESVIKELEA